MPARASFMALHGPFMPFMWTAVAVAPALSSISATDDLIATRTNADERDRRLDERLDAVQVDPRGAREVAEGARVLRRLLPAIEPFVARDRMLEDLEVAREFRVHIAVRLVPGADRHA